MKRYVFSFRWIVAAVVLIFSVTIVSPVMAKGLKSKDFKHDGIGYFVSGHRIQLKLNVTGVKSLKNAYCFFRVKPGGDFLFVDMTLKTKNNYQCILPKPDAGTKEIEYFFSAETSDKNIAKSKTYKMNKKKQNTVPSWQKVNSKYKISVFRESKEHTAVGFKDSIVLKTQKINKSFLSGKTYGVSNKVIAGIAGGLALGGVVYAISDNSSGSSGDDGPDDGSDGTLPPPTDPTPPAPPIGPNMNGTWHGVLILYKGGQENVTAEITHSAEIITIHTSASSNVGRDFEGKISQHGYVTAQDLYNYKIWTTHFEWASEHQMDIYDFVDHERGFNILRLDR